MGVQGIPHGFTDQEIFDAIEKTKGVVVRASELLCLSPRALHEILSEKPHLRTALREIRRQFQYEMVDQSEQVLCKSIYQEEDLSLALRAATYILNNLGRDRGYCHPEVSKAIEERCIADKLLGSSAAPTLSEDGKNLIIGESLGNVIEDFINATQQHTK